MIGTEIFWVNCVALFIILFTCAVIGRSFIVFFPYRLRPFAAYFLSPSIGMALLIVIASLIGRFVPIAEFISSYGYIGLFAVLISLIITGKKREIMLHASIVGIFGLFCAMPFLAQLFFYGGYNSHNDVFTYLAISDWLQHHEFNIPIPNDQITPASTQILAYQIYGFRMGGSYFLAFVQAIAKIRWAYTIYPSVILAPLALCCLSIGFPIFSRFHGIPRWVQLSLLILPSLSFGGLVFGSLYGFFAQIFGLAMGSGALFLLGAMLSYIPREKVPLYQRMGTALPVALLLTACTVSYSEISMFIALAMIVSIIIFMIKEHSFIAYFTYGIILCILSILFINFELPRILIAIFTQSKAIVGGPINWTLLGFVAHMIGVHGGGWDIFQWSVLMPGSFNLILGCILLIFLMLLCLKYRHSFLKHMTQGILLPSVLILLIFTMGIIYFRYFVPNPFPIGMGQSWSQFKLTDWAHPFTALLIIYSIVFLLRGHPYVLKCGVIALLGSLILLNIFLSQERMHSFTNYYHGIVNLDQFYKKSRQFVLSECPKHVPIYLNLMGSDHKFRQMLALFLADQPLKSDWHGDGYIINALPENKREQKPDMGDCYIERVITKSASGNPEDFIKIQVVKGNENMLITSTEGTYGREFDNENWWYWVRSKAVFKLKPFMIIPGNTQTKVSFQYAARGKQRLEVRILGQHDQELSFFLEGQDKMQNFEKIIDISPSELAELSIETDGIATTLGPNDSRQAAWIMRNLTVSPF